MNWIRKAFFSRPLVWYLAAAMMIMTSVPREASAGIISSRAFVEGSRQADINKIQSVLEMDMVSQRLLDLGFTTEEVRDKVESYSDADIHQLAMDLEQLQGGGDDGLGIIISLLVIVLLVVIILQVSGHKIIVTK